MEVDENFRALFYRCRRLLLFFFERRGFDAGLREDLVQETMLNVFRGIGDFRGEAHFDAWLFQIAANVARGHRRRRFATKRRAVVIPLDELAGGPDVDEPGGLQASGADPLDLALGREQMDAFERAVGELPDQMRQCALLRYRSELKYAEIANLLGISLDSVRVQLWRARGRLREAIGEPMGALGDEEARG